MKKFFITIFVLFGFVLLADKAFCADAVETPAEGLQDIITLYENKDFSALVKTRYAELYKAEKEGMVDALVARFEKRFANQKKIDRAVGLYRSLLDMQPEISADGSTATYNLGQGFVKLSLMPDGRWGFHL